MRALEAQQQRLGGSPEQLGEFRASHLGIYRDLVELLVELGRPEEAFAALESGRARAMLALLAERDLVVLSACRSAVGQEVAGEGMVGLTRAFQYPGARAVLASLWGVADVSTAELMMRFYAHRQTGESTDQALRAAQLELVRTTLAAKAGDGVVEHDVSHPFHWAAFQLYGDWR